MSLRSSVKRAIDWCCTIAVSPAGLTCAIERRSSKGEAVFTFWAQTFALVPGLPGVFLRRAFYRSALDGCGRSFFIGFGALISHRHARIDDDVYIGPYAVVGSCHLERGCLIGTRCSIISGGELHTLDENLRWTASDLSRLKRIRVGEYAWLGEGTLVMADIGRAAMIAAGAVVASAVPPETVVAGNPARFVRRLSA